MEKIEYMDRFPVTLYMRPGLKFSVKLGRKLFGLQRYGITATGTNYAYSCDYATREEAQIIANTATLLSRFFEVCETNPGAIGDIALQFFNEEDLNGLSDRSLMGRIVHGVLPVELSRVLTEWFN